MTFKNEMNWYWGAFLGLCISLHGCGDGGFGESVAVPQEVRTRFTGGLSAGERVSFPAAKEFNIAQSARQSTGDGHAEATASATGNATCQIKAAGASSASGEFQLGHVIYNDTDTPLDISVQFEFDYEFEITDRGPDSRVPDTVGLKVFVQNSDHTVLNRRTILEQGDGLGAWKGTGHESPWFNLTLEPRLAYNLVLAGKLAANAEEEGKPVEAQIGVSGLRIDIRARDIPSKR